MCFLLMTLVLSNVYFNCIVQDSLFHDMDIGTMWHCALVSCNPLHSLLLLSLLFFFFLVVVVVVGPLLWYWGSLCVPFTVPLIQFYFIMIFFMIIFILNYMSKLSVTKQFWFCKYTTLPTSWKTVLRNCVACWPPYTSRQSKKSAIQGTGNNPQWRLFSRRGTGHTQETTYRSHWNQYAARYVNTSSSHRPFATRALTSVCQVVVVTTVFFQ